MRKPQSRHAANMQPPDEKVGGGGVLPGAAWVILIQEK